MKILRTALLALTATIAAAAEPPAPQTEFAFEFEVGLAPPVVLGDTVLGHRQYIPITGGKITGPRLTGEVIPGGWDYQLGLPDGCSQLSADYFIKAQDGTIIHVLDAGLVCAGAPKEPYYYRPTFEAPKGPHEWLTHATFVASAEVMGADKGKAPTGIRIRFYQVK
jgi:hypothetical protein